MTASTKPVLSNVSASQNVTGRTETRPRSLIWPRSTRKREIAQSRRATGSAATDAHERRPARADGAAAGIAEGGPVSGDRDAAGVAGWRPSRPTR